MLPRSFSFVQTTSIGLFLPSCFFHLSRRSSGAFAAVLSPEMRVSSEIVVYTQYILLNFAAESVCEA